MTRFTFTFVVLVSILLAVQSGGREAPNLERTLEAQKRMVSEQPHHAKGHNDLGNLLVLAGRLDEAELAYGRALELDPLSTSAGFNLGLLLQQGGRSKEALEAFNAVIELDPKHAWATYQAGVVLHERGKRKEAVERYARAFALDSSLTFAKTNPHFIDNDLATQALLMSERYMDSDSTRMPRLYGEPDRIVDLMLQAEESESAERAAGEARESTQTQEQTRKRRPRPVEHGDGGGQPGLPQQPQAGDDEEEENKQARQGSNSVQVVGGAVVGSANTGRNEGRASGNARQRTTPGRGATVNRARPQSGETTGRGTIQRQSPRRSRYRPATTSTGRLELELLPQEEELERVTR